jgi:hypothetical protein
MILRVVRARLSDELRDIRMKLEELLPPVTDLGRDFATAIGAWRWLLPTPPSPLLITMLGDLFIDIRDEVFFLDTTRGTVSAAAASRNDWKRLLQDPGRVFEWFAPMFVRDLLGSATELNSGEVYSPIIPPVLGGAMTPDNYMPTQWRMHLHVLGQVHQQIQGLPPGAIVDLKLDPFS